MTTSDGTLKYIIEAALLAAGRPLSVDALLALFLDDEQPDRADIKAALEELAGEYAERGIEVREVSSGWRIQVRSQYAPWVSRLWEEKPPRYSRALMETLALIAYRQPITRGEIEEIRGVAVSTNIVKTLLEREWVRVVGHRDVPGKPALYATTKAFLDYFGLKGLDDLPTLAEIRDLDSLNQEFNFPDEAGSNAEAQGDDVVLAISDDAGDADAGAEAELSIDIDDEVETPDETLAGDAVDEVRHAEEEIAAEGEPDADKDDVRDDEGADRSEAPAAGESRSSPDEEISSDTVEESQEAVPRVSSDAADQ